MVDLDEPELDLRGDKYSWDIQPQHRRHTDGTEYVDDYTFGQVHMEFELDAVLPDGAKAEYVGSSVIYRYKRKPAIKVTRDKVYCKPDAGKKEARKQAYFVLSILESEGYVTGWRKR